MREVLGEGLALGVPALLLVGGVAVVFMRLTPYFLTAVFEHHVLQEAGSQPLGRRLQGPALLPELYCGPAGGGGAGGVGGALRVARRGKALETLPLWQFPTALVFLVLTRPVFLRHLTYLAPAMMALAALPLWSLLRGQWQVWRPAEGGMGRDSTPTVGLEGGVWC